MRRQQPEPGQPREVEFTAASEDELLHLVAGLGHVYESSRPFGRRDATSTIHQRGHGLGQITTISHEDNEQLNRATELLRDIIARHRCEDLRALTVLNTAIQDIRVGSRYLSACAPAPARK